MIQHFTYERLYAGELPGWRISFYYNRIKHDALYLGDGTIEMVHPLEAKLSSKVKQDLHELMVFHIYD
ncbi:DUF5342 family protein [Kurthia sibirica]|uniref:YheE family protein n=1 Tax=Kurthia sibirica TaxID=202750 RepID=A0A2U3AFQ8_9BACL|nr:DUF5342 family protein [Kurthia sibirica]PWI23386.1 hypothetical protein DEX24_16110 [Kurthia sibirica]GEK35385.1 hypothetical protein KSI01_29180 [Kurthia sibirica]